MSEGKWKTWWIPGSRQWTKNKRTNKNLKETVEYEVDSVAIGKQST